MARNSKPSPGARHEEPPRAEAREVGTHAPEQELQERIHGLIRQLNYPAAVEALAAVGQKAVPALIDALEHSDPDTRGNAAVALGWIPAPAAVPRLIELLDDGQASVRWGAAWALGFIRAPTPAALPRLIELLGDGDAQVRAMAVWALGGLGASLAALPRLIELLDDSDAQVRDSAACALGAIGAPASAAVPALVEALGDGDASLRVTAACALGRIGALAAAVPRLIELLGDGDAEVRRTATEALAKIGAPASAAVPGLVAALKSEKDNEVRRTIAQAIEVIMASTAKAERKAAAATATAWEAGRPALLELCKRDPSKIVRLQAHESLQRLGAECGPEPDAVSGDHNDRPPLGDDVTKELSRASRQLHTFCLVGEVLLEDGIDTFVIGWMARQLLDRKKLAVKYTTLRDHLEKVRELFAAHLPEMDLIYDGGQGERGYTVTSQWSSAWDAAMWILGRDPVAARTAARQRA